MFETILNFFKNMRRQEKEQVKSKDAAKERLHLVLMQDRANVSADFLDLMKQEIIEVIKKYIEVDENAIDVRLTNKDNGDGTNGAPALYANIPIKNIKDEVKSGMAREKKVETELLATNKESKEEKAQLSIEEQKKDNAEIIEEKVEEEKSDNSDNKEKCEEKEVMEKTTEKQNN